MRRDGETERDEEAMRRDEERLGEKKERLGEIEGSWERERD